MVLPAGLLAQSVPGTGELPQTFETTEELVARPSWNTLGVRTTGPVTAPKGLAQLTSLAFQGATTGLAANDVILLFDGGATPTPVLVQAVSVDLASQVTSVTLQQPQGGAAASAALAAEPVPPGPAKNGTPITTVIDSLLPGLRTLPQTPPASAAALNRTPAEVFTPHSDAIPRLVAALDPVLAGTIYKALGTASIGSAAVTAAQALQVQATPFGVRMPPRPVFNSQGQQVGTEEWPIGDVQVLSAQMTWIQTSRSGLNGTAQVSVQGPDGASPKRRSPGHLAARVREMPARQPRQPDGGPRPRQRASPSHLQPSERPPPRPGHMTLSVAPARPTGSSSPSLSMTAASSSGCRRCKRMSASPSATIGSPSGGSRPRPVQIVSRLSSASR